MSRTCLLCDGTLSQWSAAAWSATAPVRWQAWLHLTEWFTDASVMMTATSVGVLAGALYALVEGRHLARRATRGAWIGLTAPVSLPVLATYYAFIKRS